MEKYDEFEEQLRLEEVEREKEASKKVRTDEDGTVYEFDEEKKAWFPKIDDFFIAKYQMNYGETPANLSSHNANINELMARKPADINSEEYRSWYEEYCRLYHAQQAEIAKNEERVSKELEKFIKNKNDEEDEDENVDAKAVIKIDDDSEKKDEKLEKSKAKKLAKEKAKRKITEPAWCEVGENKNTNVYVCGLPEETTEEEFVTLMSKVGLLAVDPISKRAKVKLYKREDGLNKGDARCCYVKPESVQLALDIIDGSEVHGHRISVERARFEMKGSFDPGKKRRKLSKVERKKWKENQEKLLGWTPDNEDSRPSYERVVVIKNVFDHQLMQKEPSQVGEIMMDVRDEAKKFGRVKKVTVYDRNEEGVVTVAFKSPAEADVCVAALNGRWFDKRLLSACNWDGRSKYLVEESEEQMEERLKKWHSYLQSSEDAAAAADVGGDYDAGCGGDGGGGGGGVDDGVCPGAAGGSNGVGVTGNKDAGGSGDESGGDNSDDSDDGDDSGGGSGSKDDGALGNDNASTDTVENITSNDMDSVKVKNDEKLTNNVDEKDSLNEVSIN